VCVIRSTPVSASRRSERSPPDPGSGFAREPSGDSDALRRAPSHSAAFNRWNVGTPLSDCDCRRRSDDAMGRVGVRPHGAVYLSHEPTLAVDIPRNTVPGAGALDVDPAAVLLDESGDDPRSRARAAPLGPLGRVETGRRVCFFMSAGMPTPLSVTYRPDTFLLGPSPLSRPRSGDDACSIASEPPVGHG